MIGMPHGLYKLPPMNIKWVPITTEWGPITTESVFGPPVATCVLGVGCGGGAASQLLNLPGNA